MVHLDVTVLAAGGVAFARAQLGAVFLGRRRRRRVVGVGIAAGVFGRRRHAFLFAEFGASVLEPHLAAERRQR